jgi:hypothetical protein
LIGSFAARANSKVFAQNGLARTRQIARRDECEVGDENTKDADGMGHRMNAAISIKPSHGAARAR